MAQSAIYARVYGIVQGVGYRFFAQRRARQLGLTGYVRNLPDGSVEVYAEGDEQALKSFLIELRQGPIAAEVHDVSVEWKEPTGKWNDFEITF